MNEMLNKQTFTVETQCPLTAVTFIRIICWHLRMLPSESPCWTRSNNVFQSCCSPHCVLMHKQNKTITYRHN